MSTIGAAPRAAISSARAEASRRNGAKSRGPKTPEGKARASRNALTHGLRAAKHVVLPDEDAAAFAALEAALLEELAPEGALQAALARQIVSAAWRLARADRIEAEMLIFRQRGDADLGLAFTRDANTARALPALVRYRGAAQAEFLRSLRTLQALQAQAAKPAPATGPATVLAFGPERRRAGAAPDPRAGKDVPPGAPNEPERRGDVGRSAPAPAGKPDQETSAATGAGSSARKAPGGATPPAPRRLEPNEPDGAASRDLRPASRAASARTQSAGSIA
jgi:hypothetical protein